jgi:hypothetical protein
MRGFGAAHGDADLTSAPTVSLLGQRSSPENSR